MMFEYVFGDITVRSVYNGLTDKAHTPAQHEDAV